MLMKGHHALFCTLVLAACSNDVTTTGSGGGTQTGSSTQATSATTATGSSSTSSGAGGGAGQAPGECKTNADCPPDGSCIELLLGGYRVCQYPVVEATSCTDPSSDQCCKTAECGVGEKCVFGPFPGSCGGAFQLPHNQCVKDACAGPADCQANEICAPAGTLANKVRVCIPAPCSSAQCPTSQENIGWCVAVKNPCCEATLGLHCAKGCVTDIDCPGGYCDVDGNTGFTVCTPGVPACPG